MGLQAALLTSAALTTEVNAFKQSLERSENELGRAKNQLEDKEGQQHLIKVVPYRKGFGCKINDKDNMGTSGATNEVATLKEAVSAAERDAAAERVEREKQEVRVVEVQQELQALVEKHESLEHDSKTRESELALALESAKTARTKPRRPFRRSR